MNKASDCFPTSDLDIDNWTILLYDEQHECIQIPSAFMLTNLYYVPGTYTSKGKYGYMEGEYESYLWRI